MRSPNPELVRMVEVIRTEPNVSISGLKQNYNFKTHDYSYLLYGSQTASF